MSESATHRRVAEAKVIEANVTFYLQMAEKYDTYEPYLFDPVLQQSLEDDLDKIGSHFAGLDHSPACLECGGGTGNLTLKMCKRGWAVSVVDVSEKMLGLLRQKAQTRGYSPTLIHSPIEQFLDATHEDYDLVAFSSVLHHLYSYSSVVERSLKRLAPGGVFYSNYDPLAPKNPFFAHLFDSLDTTLAKALYDPADILPGIGRRLRKLFSRSDPEFSRSVVSAGDLAEFHARTGMDDQRILQILQKNGFSIVQHQRFATGRTTLTRALNQRLRLLESFKIIALRNSHEIRT
jgi:ubiquinone/menaquinone biosynthesis C-methylase UbiE